MIILAAALAAALSTSAQAQVARTVGDDSVPVWFRPVFTPYQQASRLANAVEVQEPSARLLPHGADGYLNRDDSASVPLGDPGPSFSVGPPRVVAVWLYVSESGEVANALLAESSEDRGLDSVSMRLSWRMEFEPARIVAGPWVPGCGRRSRFGAEPTWPHTRRSWAASTSVSAG